MWKFYGVCFSAGNVSGCLMWLRLLHKFRVPPSFRRTPEQIKCRFLRWHISSKIILRSIYLRIRITLSLSLKIVRPSKRIQFKNWVAWNVRLPFDCGMDKNGLILKVKNHFKSCLYHIQKIVCVFSGDLLWLFISCKTFFNVTVWKTLSLLCCIA